MRPFQLRSSRSCRERLVERGCPGSEVFEAAIELDAGLPTQFLLRFGDIAHVVGLVPLAPVRERVVRLLVDELTDLVDDSEQGALVRHSAADVVDLASRLFDLLDHGLVKRGEVSRIQEVSNLRAIAVDGQWAVAEDGMHEVRDPALILGAVLVSAVDTALAEDHCVHVEAARVVPDVLVGGAFAAHVRAVEVERRRFLARTAVVVELSVHLVGRGEDERCFGVVLAGRLEEVQRAASVDLEIGFRVDQGCGHRHLGGEVEDRILVLDLLGQGAGVSDVLFDEGGAGRMLRDEPPEVSLCTAAAQVVENRNVPASPPALSDSDVKSLRSNWAGEARMANIYDALAQVAANPRARNRLNALAETERHHAQG